MRLTKPVQLPLVYAGLCKRRGFTLIELMVTLVIFAILSLLAMPSFNTWIANNRVSAVAEDIANGLRLAQTEAVRRSRQTVFALTDIPDPAAGANGGAGYTAVQDGSAWAVSIAQSTMDPNGLFVRGSNIADIGTGVIVTGPAAVCFGPQGFLVANDDSVAGEGTGVGGACELPTDPNKPVQIYQIKSASVAGDRPLQIEVSLGGEVRLCNPAQSLSDSTFDTGEGCQYPQPPSLS